jgi:hypothetical protein
VVVISMVVVMIIPIVVCMPAMTVFVPPFVILAPAILPRLMQLVARILRLWTVPAMMFRSFVKPVVGLRKAMSARIVIRSSTRCCSKKQDSAECSRGQHGPPDQSDTSTQKRLHQSIPPIVRSGMGWRSFPQRSTGRRPSCPILHTCRAVTETQNPITQSAGSYFLGAPTLAVLPHARVGLLFAGSTHYLLFLLANAVDQLPYPRQMMIIMLRDKIQMVHEPHRRLQTRVRNDASK